MSDLGIFLTGLFALGAIAIIGIGFHLQMVGGGKQ